MKRSALFLSFTALTVLAFVAGCEQQNTVSIDPANVKQARLVAAENIKLQKQLKECQREIEKQKSLLEKCRAEIEEEKQRGNKLTEFLFEENIRLTEENKKLKAMVK